MVEQLDLLGGALKLPNGTLSERPLTDRQQHALDYLTAAGHTGRTADEVGAELCARRGKHAAGDRCVWCAKAGNEVLRALRRHGKVKQLRNGTGCWVALELPEDAGDDRYPAFNQEIPF